jgi:hypothetical protein
MSQPFLEVNLGSYQYRADWCGVSLIKGGTDELFYLDSREMPGPAFWAVRHQVQLALIALAAGVASLALL